MPTHQMIHQARRNGRSHRQFPGTMPMNSDRVLDLLVEGCQPGRHAAVRRNTACLIERMSLQAWRVSAGVHQGGHGGAQGADRTRHITVSFGVGQSYHLRVDARGHLFQVTGPGLPHLDPAGAPGAPAVRPPGGGP